MGIIQNKASKSTVYIYIGAVIGFLNSGILFPQYLDADRKGILDLITSSSLNHGSNFFVWLTQCYSAHVSLHQKL
jgi:hypothetical protein